MMQRTAIVFFGTPEFALPSLEALLARSYNVIAVVTTPDEPAGRRQMITSPPVKILAAKHNIPVFQPDSLKNSDISKKLPPADLFIVAAYGKIIPKEILELPKQGAINTHPSLLPRWRGPSPIQYTILHGDREAGVSLMMLDERMDHGPIIIASSIQLPASSRPIYQELHDTLAKLGAKLLIETLPKYLDGALIPVPQDDARATYSKILKKDDGRINWSRSAEKIERMIRAFTPWPGAWTMWPNEGKIYRIRIEEADILEESPGEGSPGYIWQNSAHLFLIKTGAGSLIVKRLTIEGSAATDAASFLRGHSHIMGNTLI